MGGPKKIPSTGKQPVQIRRATALLPPFAGVVVSGLIWITVLRSSQAQTTYSYAGGNAGTWISAPNWTGGAAGKTPGVDGNANTTTDGTTADIAAFTSSSSIKSVGINFNTGSGNGFSANGAANQSLSLGAITLADGDASGTFTIGNSSTTLSGALTLNGVSVGDSQNIVLRNSSASMLTVSNAIPGGNQNMDVALGNATANVVRIDGSGNIYITSAITGAGKNLTKDGAGTGSLILAGLTPNTFSGAAIINAGSLSAQTAGSLGSTSGITVNNGGTLLLTGSGGTDRINNNAGLTLAGGATFNTSGLKEGTRPGAPSNGTPGAVGIGALTLQGASASLHATIDFGASGSGSVLVFNSLSGGGYLDVLNWTGAARGDDGASPNDRLLFATNPGLTDAQLANLTFYNDSGIAYGAGGTIIPYGNEYEIVPAPEPGTVWGGILMLMTVAGCVRHRFGLNPDARSA